MGFYKKSNDANSERGLGGNNMDNQMEINIKPLIQIPGFSSNKKEKPDGKPRTDNINNIVVEVVDKIREFTNSVNNNRKGIVSKEMVDKINSTFFSEVFSKLGTLSAKCENIPELNKYTVKPDEMKKALAESEKKQEEIFKEVFNEYKKIIREKDMLIGKLNAEIEERKVNFSKNVTYKPINVNSPEEVVNLYETKNNQVKDLELKNELKKFGEIVREKDIEIENLKAKLEKREPDFSNVIDSNCFVNEDPNVLMSNRNHFEEIIYSKNEEIENLKFLIGIDNAKPYEIEEENIPLKAM